MLFSHNEWGLLKYEHFRRVKTQMHFLQLCLILVSWNLIASSKMCKYIRNDTVWWKVLITKHIQSKPKGSYCITKASKHNTKWKQVWAMEKSQILSQSVRKISTKYSEYLRWDQTIFFYESIKMVLSLVHLFIRNRNLLMVMKKQSTNTRFSLNCVNVFILFLAKEKPDNKRNNQNVCFYSTITKT